MKTLLVILDLLSLGRVANSSYTLSEVHLNKKLTSKLKKNEENQARHLAAKLIIFGFKNYLTFDGEAPYCLPKVFL